MDKVVLSFYECLLHESDVQLLKGSAWLNDTLISFYFEYLQMIRFKNYNNLLFVSPEVTQCIKVSPASEINIFLDPLVAKRKDFIFFVLNDHMGTDRSGGTHWSLLVYSRPENGLYHFDSSTGTNMYQAQELGTKLSRYFGFPSNRYDVTEVESLQQSNGYDCGVHVLCNTELVAVHVSHYHRVSGSGVVDKQIVLNKRKEILRLIESLKSL